MSAKEMRDESSLLQYCQWLSVQPEADKRIKNIVQMVHKGEITVNKVQNYYELLKEHEEEVKELLLENEELKTENRKLTMKLNHQKQEYQKLKKLQEEFGITINISA